MVKDRSHEITVATNIGKFWWCFWGKIFTLQQNMGIFHGSISLNCCFSEYERKIFHMTTITHAHCPITCDAHIQLLMMHISLCVVIKKWFLSSIFCSKIIKDLKICEWKFLFIMLHFIWFKRWRLIFFIMDLIIKYFCSLDLSQVFGFKQAIYIYTLAPHCYALQVTSNLLLSFFYHVPIWFSISCYYLYQFQI
jgi:hypothetical protein